MSDRTRYLAIFLSTVCLVFAAAWLYSVEGRYGFSESEYAVWQAKLDMIDRCDLGEVAILGESRASVGFIPDTFPVTVSNLALSGSGPIEAYYEWRRMRRCAQLPRKVILSYWPDLFSKLDWFWPRNTRFGLFSYADLEEIRANEASLAPGTLYRTARAGQLPPAVDNWLHARHFPSFDFANFISSGLVGRLSANRRAYQDTLAGRGHHQINPFGDDPRARQVCASDAMPMQKHFQQAPLVTYYFAKLLSEMQSEGIRIAFVQTPVSRVTERKISADYREAFQSFIRKYDGYFGQQASVRKDAFPEIDDCDFVDGTHMTPAAARIFSTAAASALFGGPQDQQIIEAGMKLRTPAPGSENSPLPGPGPSVDSPER